MAISCGNLVEITIDGCVECDCHTCSKKTGMVVSIDDHPYYPYEVEFFDCEDLIHCSFSEEELEKLE